MKSLLRCLLPLFATFFLLSPDAAQSGNSRRQLTVTLIDGGVSLLLVGGIGYGARRAQSTAVQSVPWSAV